MNKNEQAKFVRELMENLCKEIVQDIFSGKTPDSWDGIELRRLIALRAQRACIGDMGKSRKRDFDNTVLVNDL